MNGTPNRNDAVLDSHVTTDGPAAPRLATRAPEAPLRRHVAQRDVRPRPHEPSLGELKARHRELHLCFRCTHHQVCGMARGLDPQLLVTIATCLAFEPAEPDGSDWVPERLPLNPLPDHIAAPDEDLASAVARRDSP